MRCQWNSLLNLVPPRIRNQVDHIGKEQLQELRIRIGHRIELVMQCGSVWLQDIAIKEDVQFAINASCQYSPWSASGIGQGYISAQGGHRVGVCGAVVVSNNECTSMDNITSVCIRVARDIPDIATGLIGLPGSVLLIGPPGCGKTTLLRDMIRSYSDSDAGSVAVVDERGELFPYFQREPCFPTGKRTDVLSGCPKSTGVNILLRCMGPSVIAVDEITEEDDCKALLLAGGCGVKLIATAHASSALDLCKRPVYKRLLDSGLFDHLVVLQRDKTWMLERMPV